MQKTLSLIFIFVWFNSSAQDQDSISYDSNMIGNWELYSFIKTDRTGKGIDTSYINLDSVYWNLILRIESDSIQELYIPTGKMKDLPVQDAKCKWGLYKEENRLWISLPCGSKAVRGDSEIIYVSKEEFHIWVDHDNGPWLVKFRRIDLNKL